jgi:protein SCO1/2
LIHTTVCAVLLLGLSGVPFARADEPDKRPAELEGVGVTPRLEEQLPLQLSFRDQMDQPVQIGDYFGKGRPVILTFNYSSCPMLCSLQLSGLVNSLKGMDRTPGREFEVVTVGIDPKETPSRARDAQQKYIQALGKPEAVTGWHFLTGTEANIKALAKAVGYGYRYDPRQQQYAHTAALILCSPEGKVTRYLYGIEYKPQTLQLALDQSSKGIAGGIVDETTESAWNCFPWNPNANNYSMAARTIMKAGGALTVLFLAVWLGRTWLRSPHPRPAPMEKTLP